ncbi:hypothetical protein AAFF_G00032530 [Aldrovandia affinis]|uniref:Uncharacterized protein n=1 Tax=Aldrovandia affinis TaxID=143900 RepID=A0AAD7WGW4_9TELE|nr:hypothetical protein AAFF_G00032530 [Aldrovandia affinis]
MGRRGYDAEFWGRAGVPEGGPGRQVKIAERTLKAHGRPGILGKASDTVTLTSLRPTGALRREPCWPRPTRTQTLHECWEYLLRDRPKWVEVKLCCEEGDALSHDTLSPWGTQCTPLPIGCGGVAQTPGPGAHR